MSEQGEEVHAKMGLRVLFLDPTGSKMVEAVIAPGVPVRRLLPNVVSKLELPELGLDGQPISYSLDWVLQGRRLLETETLESAGVRDGDELMVHAEMIAGIGCDGCDYGWMDR